MFVKFKLLQIRFFNCKNPFIRIKIVKSLGILNKPSKDAGKSDKKESKVQTHLITLNTISGSI